MEALNLAGIPIVTYQGYNGGIGIAEGYRLDRSILNTDEVSSIITSLEGMARVVPENRHEILLEKLKNILNLSQLETVDVKTRQLVIDPTPWLDNRHIKEKLATLKKAVEEQKEVQFRYVDPTGNETQRRVEPYSLLMKGQNWYLYAFCLLRQDFRLFKLSRIRDYPVTDGVFAPRPLPEERTLGREGVVDNWKPSCIGTQVRKIHEGGCDRVVRGRNYRRRRRADPGQYSTFRERVALWFLIKLWQWDRSDQPSSYSEDRCRNSRKNLPKIR